MRILLITALDVWSLAGQGGAPSLYKTLEAYGRRGHQVEVVSPTIGANHHFGEPPIPPPEIGGVSFSQFHLPSLAGSRARMPAPLARADQKMRFALAFPLMAARGATSLAALEQVDLLYGYEVHGILAQRLVKRRLKRPLVARFQGTIMRPYLDDRLQLLRRFEETMALKTRADLYIMTNDGTQGDEVLDRLNSHSRGRVKFWRNGLDLQNVRPPTKEEVQEARNSLGIGHDQFVMVTATRLARWKRVDRAIEALALLRKETAGASLFVVGDGEERADLEHLALERGVGEAVTFTGAVPQSEVHRYVWAADVFLSVNELSNVGNPLLEAMASGSCILTLDEGDTRDLITDGETGVLLKSGEPARIARALSLLARSSDFRARLAEGALAFARSNFWSWEARMNAEVDEVEALAAGARTETDSRV